MCLNNWDIQNITHILLIYANILHYYLRQIYLNLILKEFQYIIIKLFIFIIIFHIILTFLIVHILLLKLLKIFSLLKMINKLWNILFIFKINILYKNLIWFGNLFVKKFQNLYINLWISLYMLDLYILIKLIAFFLIKNESKKILIRIW